MDKESLKFLFICFIFLLFIIVDQFFSIFIWFLFYFIGKKISDIFYVSIPCKNYFELFYFIFSLLGLIIIVDNYYNFGELTGFAGDDYKYLNSTKYLIGQYNKHDLEVSFFCYVLAILAFPISIIKDVALTDLISFNWFIAAFIGALINKLFFILRNRDIPLYVFIFAYPFQFIITDSFSRLYRDNLLIFFVLIGTIEIFKENNKNTFLAIIPIAILRLANILNVGIVLLFYRIGVKSLRSVFLLFFCIIIFSTSFLPTALQFAMMYGSDISRTGRYVSAFDNLSPEDLIKSRFSEAQATKNSLMAESYSNNSVKSIGIRFAFSYFFPLQFRNPNSFMMHSRLGKIRGFYTYYFINWINTISLVFVFPLLFLGIYKNEDPQILVIISSSIVYLLIVLLVSGQGRHTIGSYIFNSIVAANGFFLIQTNQRLKSIYFGLSVISFLFILFYNTLIV